MYRGDDLRNFGFRRLFGLLDFVDLLISLFGQGGQIVLEAHHAVIGRAIRVFLSAILIGNLARSDLTLAESISKIVDRITLLLGKRTGPSIAQHLSKIDKIRFDLSAIQPAVR
ncbi:MAG: hypothetical protein VYA67_17165 [Actinomycetota bacterium]|uniref:Uncharacterized protein n=1 Tax=Mycobacterium lentiflavum TaxID=141349 RepID=A0ABY3ULJ3_MYCLN|nr:hypothetical protein [Mycobacterium lentiflavum]MEE3065651.1 hypothetical protein [Actinomycetota bacterium]ULP40477.1 hypothetical protein MJO58_15860 [Mycobacterium lentiflavum]